MNTNSHFSKRANRFGAEHPRQVAWLRIAIGIWLLCLMAALYGTGHGGQWAWLLAVGTVVHFGYAYRLFHFARSDSRPRAHLG
jgi:fatty acid desaturase